MIDDLDARLADLWDNIRYDAGVTWQYLTEAQREGLRAAYGLGVSTAAARIAELEAQVAVMARALGRIAKDRDCGCIPCRGQCTSKEALLIETDALRDIAKDFIANLPASAKPGSQGGERE